jgi:hypothetical protein
VDQITGTTPADGPTGTQDEAPSADGVTASDRPEVDQPGFAARGRMRRRARFLRKARELAYRDLGGLVFSLHRYGQRNDALVMAKLATLGHIDAELRALESTLASHAPVTVLREAGITACARCAAIHSSEDRFCPNCGLSLGPHADLPIAGAPAAATASVPIAPQAAPPPAPPPPSQSTAAMPVPAAAQTPPPTPQPPPAAAQTPPAATQRPPTAANPPAIPPEPSPQASPDADEPTEILRPTSPGQ